MAKLDPTLKADAGWRPAPSVPLPNEPLKKNLMPNPYQGLAPKRGIVTGPTVSSTLGLGQAFWHHYGPVLKAMGIQAVMEGSDYFLPALQDVVSYYAGRPSGFGMPAMTFAATAMLGGSQSDMQRHYQQQAWQNWARGRTARLARPANYRWKPSISGGRMVPR